MASVYSNCIVSIATRHATSPNMSCFAERIQHFFEDFEDSVMSWHGFDIGEAPHYVFDWNVSGNGALRSSRLSTRAWVIQERLLSPRALHFCSNQIFWKCSELAPWGTISISEESAPSSEPSRTFSLQFADAEWKWPITAPMRLQRIDSGSRS
jgi:hypothetical protein